MKSLTVPPEEPFSGLIQMWLILCGGSTAALVAYSLSAWTGSTAPPFSFGWWIAFLTTSIAGLCELRYCLGHHIYLKSLVGVEGWGRAKWDFRLMFLITVCKLALDFTISHPVAFVICFLGLMLADVLWLVFEPKVRTVENVTTFKPAFWLWINLATALLILLAATLIPFENARLLCQLIIAAANCIVDIGCCIGPMGRSKE